MRSHARRLLSCKVEDEWKPIWLREVDAMLKALLSSDFGAVAVDMSRPVGLMHTYRFLRNA